MMKPDPDPRCALPRRGARSTPMCTTEGRTWATAALTLREYASSSWASGSAAGVAGPAGLASASSSTARSLGSESRSRGAIATEIGGHPRDFQAAPWHLALGFGASCRRAARLRGPAPQPRTGLESNQAAEYVTDDERAGNRHDRSSTYRRARRVGQLRLHFLGSFGIGRRPPRGRPGCIGGAIDRVVDRFAGSIDLRYGFLGQPIG